MVFVSDIGIALKDRYGTMPDVNVMEDVDDPRLPWQWQHPKLRESLGN